MKAFLNLNLAASLLAGLLFFPLAQADELLKKTVDISDIDAVEIAGPGLLSISQGDTEALEIIASAKAMERVEVDARGSTLRLRLKDGSSWGWFKMDNNIHYKLSLKTLNKLRSAGSVDTEFLTHLTGDALKLDRAGSGDLRAKAIIVKKFSLSSAGSGDFSADVIQADEIELSSAGSGDLRANSMKATDLIEVSSAGSGDTRIDQLNTSRFEITMGGSGDAQINGGEVDSQRVSVSGSGNYTAPKMKSRDAQVDLSGSADAKVWATDSLEVDASGASDVHYYGQPSIKVDTSGASSVKSLGMSPH
ncbi:GIN domain-containing protein [Simiduia agarivorans]|uniref:Putative auto-transporter adhesin head GIN domain-containing protein n=1 Tax=Simiduia agarivorans (strain DSM 21679 / JCM 13881 / BCRC 17597 / SA1) TaxID=1117647 RepID=K4KRG7_SIMAS|nr:DUF2807 domain-containing protein [Simiduia agarivorans]AFV00886.1 hypothetical protein M5M_18785 [Simiduia agarivorans SA1 = DSM 21679]